MKRIVVLLSIALTSCGGGSYTPPAPPQPPAPPAISISVFDEGWAAPDVGLSCGYDVPLECTGTAKWLTFDRVGTQGRDCVMPGPCWTPGLKFTADDPGYPLISRQTFDRTKVLTLEADVSVTCREPQTGDGCYAAVTWYNGENNYRGIYYRSWQNRLQLYWFSTALAVPLSGTIYQPGSPHKLRVVYDRATWRAYVDGVLLLTEAAPLGPDATELVNDPHASLWLGQGEGSVGVLRVSEE